MDAITLTESKVKGVLRIETGPVVRCVAALVVCEEEPVLDSSLQISPLEFD